MKKPVLLILVLVILGVAALVLLKFSGKFNSQNSLDQVSTEQTISVSSDGSLKVTSPRQNATISSPVTLTGEARGTWFFEGSFPVELLDANGDSVAKGFVTAQGEWMTKDFVTFEGTLEFTAPGTESGILQFIADNPSGLPGNEKTFTVPVKF